MYGCTTWDFFVQRMWSTSVQWALSKEECIENMDFGFKGDKLVDEKRAISSTGNGMGKAPEAKVLV